MGSRWAQSEKQYLERIALAVELLALLEHKKQEVELAKCCMQPDYKRIGECVNRIRQNVDTHYMG